MSLKNRTPEFFSIVESVRQNGMANGFKKDGKHANGKVANATGFTKMAASVGRDINTTASKLEKLTKLVKKKSIFDDRPVEIQEMTFIVKQDINALNSKIAQLSQFVASQQTKNKQANDFSNQIVVFLQSKLATTSSSFKDILEIRTQNMKAQKDRREQFSTNQLTVKPSSSSSALYRRGTEKTEKEDFIAIDMGSPSQSLEMVQQQDNYSETRHEEIRNIEQTINQLGSIFQQLANLVAQQGEQVQSIDRYVDEAESNILEGERQLIQGWQTVSSNRWLMIKIFAVLIVFFMIFVIFFA